MKNPAREEDKICRTDEELTRLCLETEKELDKAYGMDSRKVGKEVDFAEVKIVHLRDCLIERLRREKDVFQSERWHKILDRVNIALSYTTGVEYPATGLHRNHLEQAQKVINEAARQVKSSHASSPQG